jgi:hypothetical protein
MLHTSEPPLSIEELKEILAKIAALKVEGNLGANPDSPTF